MCAQANRKQVDVRQSDIIEHDRATRAGAGRRKRKSRRNSATPKIYAPIDGIVSVRVAKQGEVVAQGSPIVVLVDINHFWVRADVEESYIDNVQFGQTMQRSAAFRKYSRRPGVLQGRRKRFRHAARREPHEARHQNLRDQSFPAE